MATWTRKVPEVKDGDYHFNGKFLITQGVKNALSEKEIQTIFEDVQSFVKEKDGADYLQVYENENGDRLFFIDNMSKKMIQQGYDPNNPEENYCTLMFAHEY